MHKKQQDKLTKTTSQMALLMLCVFLNVAICTAQSGEHPRIYTTDESKSEFSRSIEHNEWKKRLVEEKKQNLKKYLQYCKNDPNWLVSRLQMNWKTKHNKVFLNGGNFSHSEGEAPVPTVRFSGTRDWATDYLSPPLEDVEPNFDDPRGMYLKNRNTKEIEWVHPSKSGHIIEGINNNIMNLVGDAAFLYWLTGEKKYAEFAVPVYMQYMDGMYHREAPFDLDNSPQQKLSGLATFEVIHEGILAPLTITYDFLYNYFIKNGYDLVNSIAVFQKWADQIISNGVPNNNWNFFQARYLTYIALALDKNENYKNGKGQEYYLNHIFDITTDRQIALKESILTYDQENGIWPESPSYSIHVTTTLLRILTLLDNVTNKNEFIHFPIVEKASLAAFQYLFPSGYTVGFGDSDHKNLPAENFELLISNYRKYNLAEKELSISGILKDNLEKEGRKRGGRGLFELFFYVDTLKEGNGVAGDGSIDKFTTPTFYAPNVSLFIQRMRTNKDATMVSTVGSYGNHAHANGVAIELYANNYVLGPDMGRGASYWHPDHKEYYSRFPAHNTVVVDGISDYGAMRSHHPFKLDNCFPKSGSRPIFNKITYSKVSFLEPETMSDQQRFTAIIKSNSDKSYVVDVFRSKKQQEGNQRHDYFYHGLGQSLKLFEAEKKLDLISTNDFGTEHGDLKAYDYLTDKYKVESSKDAQAIFRLRSDGLPDNLMKIWINGSKNQKLYAAKSPKSKAITKGTAPIEAIDQLISTLILKREKAAWENPFALVFNPFIEGEENPIENVKFSTIEENPNTQIIEVLLNDSETSDKIVVNPSETDVISQDKFYQKGLLSVTRKSKQNNTIDFLFLSGIYKFNLGDWGVETVGEPVTLSFEHINGEYIVQNDKPVILKIPFVNDKKAAELRLYEDDKLVSTRKGIISRVNPEQLEFRLTKAYKKAVIRFND